MSFSFRCETFLVYHLFIRIQLVVWTGKLLRCSFYSSTGCPFPRLTIVIVTPVLCIISACIPAYSSQEICQMTSGFAGRIVSHRTMCLGPMTRRSWRASDEGMGGYGDRSVDGAPSRTPCCGWFGFGRYMAVSRIWCENNLPVITAD